MIYCELDGYKVYPNLSSSIKITMENPDLKDKGSFSLDITVPLSVYENQMVFRHLNRIDVSFKKNNYEKATLYVDHVAVISGVGVVTSVSNTEVKLQIMNANSEFKYVSGFDKKYIDDIFKWWNYPKTNGGKYLPGNPPVIREDMYAIFGKTCIDYCAAVESQVYVGDASIGIYTPVYDETKDRIVNEIAKYGNATIHPLYMINPECQPNLLYIMKEALAYFGYTADLSVIDCYPWNRIYIVNTGCILPHWTMERFITEFKALFNLSVRFVGKKAIFGRIDYDAEAVAYECLDEFTTEYDDDGIQSNVTSNLRYNLYDSAEKTYYTEIPDEIMEEFTIREYASESEMYNWFNALGNTEKSQSIFVTPTGYFYARTDDPEKEYPDYYLTRAGQFNKLVRDEDNDDAEDLNIVPVTIAKMDIKFRQIRLVYSSLYGPKPSDWFRTEDEVDLSFIMPSAASEEASDNLYATVQGALEFGDSVDNSSRSESERMEVFFLSEHTKSFYLLEVGVTTAVVGTDPTIDSEFRDQISFALERTPDGIVHIGQFHTGTRRIDGHNQRCIKFICDEIPDPTRIYLNSATLL